MNCPKCKTESGDAWWQCGGVCPMLMSPHYSAECAAKYNKPKTAKSRKRKIRAEIAEGDRDMLFCDGLDDALIGKCHIWTEKGPQEVALYDYAKCVEVLKKRDGMAQEEAEEFLQVNTLGSYVGERTPAFAILR